MKHFCDDCKTEIDRWVEQHEKGDLLRTALREAFSLVSGTFTPQLPLCSKCRPEFNALLIKTVIWY